MNNEMNEDASFAEQLIGEITGLKIALRYALGYQALASGEGNEHLEKMRFEMLASLPKSLVTAPGLNSEKIAMRASDTIDQLIDAVSVSYSK